MQNQYPLWKYLLIIGLTLLALLFALPNLYGVDPSVQISAKASASIDQQTLAKTRQVLNADRLAYKSIHKQNSTVLVRFKDTDNQLKARSAIKQVLGDNYIVALNLAPKTPAWLRAIGAEPMKYGLDLRGGVHFLLSVDVDAVIKARQDGDVRSIGDELRNARIRYLGISKVRPSGLEIRFKNQQQLDKAYSLLPTRFAEYQFSSVNSNGDHKLKGVMLQAALNKVKSYAVEQTMTILRNRVNELGVADPVIQQQGMDKVSVDLPGVQDTARAKDLLGKTATLKFQLVDTDHDAQAAQASGDVPLGDRLYPYEGRPILLKNRVILRGNSITYATSGYSDDGQPNVSIRLGGGGESLFSRVTAENVGKPLAVVYVETKQEKRQVDGKSVFVNRQVEKLISVATIQSALGNSFQITGLESPKYARDLALLLRSGALMAPVNIIQELTVGPSLGKANIQMGIRSLEIGSLLVVIFMILYYRIFGIISVLALLLNVIFIVSILSVLGATLTLPGIAGIVLTIGMAVDANVLINERIREELRNGMSIQASIQAGYERAFSTIIDSQITTLIVVVILFALGSGSVKGFAITTIFGIITSLFTSIFFTRAIVNLVYGRKTVRHLSIGINTSTSTHLV